MFTLIGRRMGLIPIDFLYFGPDYLYFLRADCAVFETLPTYPLDNSSISNLF